MQSNLKSTTFKTILASSIATVGIVSFVQTNVHADTTSPNTYSPNNTQVKHKNHHKTKSYKLTNLNQNTTNYHSNNISNLDITSYASQFLGTPYIWGGTTTSGFDCSGFTQYVYQNNLNISLPRTAQAQFNYTTRVSEKNAQVGDLVFFGSSQSNVYHVGIYLGNGKMIDSQNRGVVIENIHAPWWNLVGFGHIN